MRKSGLSLLVVAAAMVWSAAPVRADGLALPVTNLHGAQLNLVEHVDEEALILFVKAEDLSLADLKQAVAAMEKIRVHVHQDGDKEDQIDCGIVVVGEGDNLAASVAKAHEEHGILEPTFIASPHEAALAGWRLQENWKWTVVHVEKREAKEAYDAIDKLEQAIDELIKELTAGHHA